MEVKYHQINVADLKNEFEYLEYMQQEEYCIIGIEISNPDVAIHCFLNIDPQHERNSLLNNMTALEYVYKCRDDFRDLLVIFNKFLFFILKTDLDSVASICLLKMIIKNRLFSMSPTLILKFKSIAKSDRHGRLDYNEVRKKVDVDFIRDSNFNRYGIPLSLIAMVADYKLDLEQKCINMDSYLTKDTFYKIKEYVNYVKDIRKKSVLISHEIIIPDKLIFVVSNSRGAVSKGYRKCPVVIAQNFNYTFGIGINKIVGTKITIAQYEDNKYIDLIGLKDELNTIECGWGGSSCIIGSPQDRPTMIKNKLIINLAKKYLK